MVVVLDAGRLFDDPLGSSRLEQRAEWAAVVRDAAERVHKYGALGPVWTADVTAHLDRALGQDTAEQWALSSKAGRLLGAPIEAALATLRLAERLAQDGERDRAATTASKRTCDSRRRRGARTRRPDPRGGATAPAPPRRRRAGQTMAHMA